MCVCARAHVYRDVIYVSMIFVRGCMCVWMCVYVWMCVFFLEQQKFHKALQNGRLGPV